MRVFKSLKLYKNSIYNNRFFILTCLCIFTFSILLDGFVSSKEMDISELQLTYNNLSLFRQGVLYIPLCVLIILKMIEFADNTFIILRLGEKNTIWNHIIMHILLTSFIISAYLVLFSYITGLLFTRERYMEMGTTFILLISLILLYTIGLTLFSSAVLIIKILTGNKIISYMALLSILVPKVINMEGSLILSDISFSLRYLSDYRLAIFNILKFGGITILLLEFGRIFYKKIEIYNTKKLLMSGNDDED